MKLEDRMKRSIRQSKGLVFLRSDFKNMGSYSQVGRVLTKLVGEGFLARVSLGAYAKTRINRFSGNPMPAGTLEMIGREVFDKLKIEIAPNFLVEEYNSGKSTQIPVIPCVNTGGRRITRKITVGARSVEYESNATRVWAGFPPVKFSPPRKPKNKKRVGFMSDSVQVPDDFDQMGKADIEEIFGSEE